MHFCDKCDNMYYISISSENENKMSYYCRNCGNEDDNISKESICVSRTQLKKTKQTYNHIINKYTKLDPTLPRINTIRCPNSECSSNVESSDNDNDKDNKREVIYMRYDDVNMHYIYLCTKCDMVWKT
jgi:DNA-directed RNA polymerase subunit M/transcription elongation factor TFIIS